MTNQKMLKLETGSSLDYKFFSNSSGSFDFRVRARHDVRVALTTKSNVGNPMFEVIIGAYSNTKTIIRKNRREPDIHVQTLGILSEEEFRGFSVQWKTGKVIVCHEGSSIPIACWSNKEERISFTYVGVCTGWGATGSWLIKEVGHRASQTQTQSHTESAVSTNVCYTETEKWKTSLKVKTEDKLEYKFFANSSGSFDFRVRSTHDACIALATTPFVSKPMFEIIIGAWHNTKTIIRKNRAEVAVVSSTPGILSIDEFRRFSVKWKLGNVLVYAEGKDTPILSWISSKINIPFSYVGVCTGWSASGSWIIDQAQTQVSVLALSSSTTSSSVSVASASWVSASGGSVPSQAFVVSETSSEATYVARASFQGAVIPGQLVPSHGACYFSWGGIEHSVQEYEVLSYKSASWKRVSGGNIPPNAIPCGRTETNETLYVGRVKYKHSYSAGKVQASHGLCYIAQEGKEMSFSEYEILVSTSSSSSSYSSSPGFSSSASSAYSSSAAYSNSSDSVSSSMEVSSTEERSLHIQ